MRWLAAASALVLLAGCADDGSGSGAPTVTAADIDGAIDLSTDGPRSDSGRVLVPGFDEVAVEVTDEAGDVQEWCLLLADTAEEFTQGLMRVVDLGDYAGMLFDFPEGERTGGFWMRDTPLPLTAAYLDADGRIVSVVDMDPCLDRGADCPSYPPEAPYADVLEVPQGGLDAFGLDGPEARLEPVGACSPP